MVHLKWVGMDAAWQNFLKATTVSSKATEYSSRWCHILFAPTLKIDVVAMKGSPSLQFHEKNGSAISNQAETDIDATSQQKVRSYRRGFCKLPFVVAQHHLPKKIYTAVVLSTGCVVTHVWKKRQNTFSFERKDKTSSHLKDNTSPCEDAVDQTDSQLRLQYQNTKYKIPTSRGPSTFTGKTSTHSLRTR